MTLTRDLSDLEAARETARKAMSLPIGLASPMWMAFGAAAGAGVAWWWATRWTRAVNLEATASAAEAPVEAADAIVERGCEVTPGEAQIIEPSEPDSTKAAEAADTGDDLTRLTGIGPKLAAALGARGVTSFAQLAAWTEDNAAAFDAELSLKGRVARDAWVAQARRLAREA